MDSENGRGQVCQICFSASHITENCDVAKEKEMLKSAGWARELLASHGVTALEVGKDEAETSFHLVDEDGSVLGELVVIDEVRMRGEDLKATASNAGFWPSGFTLLFTAPDGTVLKLATEKPMDYVIADGVQFLRDARARETGADKTPEALEKKSKEEKERNERIAEQMGLLPEELKAMVGGRRDIFEFFSKSGDSKKTKLAQGLMDRWEGRSSASSEDSEDRYSTDEELETKLFGGLSGGVTEEFNKEHGLQFSEYRRIAAKAKDFRERRNSESSGLSLDDWRFVDDTSKSLDRFALGLGPERRLSFPLLFIGWENRGLDDPTNKELEAKLVGLLNEKEKQELEDLKKRVPRYRELRRSKNG